MCALLQAFRKNWKMLRAICQSSEVSCNISDTYKTPNERPILWQTKVVITVTLKKTSEKYSTMKLKIFTAKEASNICCQQGRLK